MLIDTSSPFGERVARRLRDEQVVWLTTVRDDGTPEPNPVWFLWEDDEVLIYNRTEARRLRNVEASPRVSLNFDGNGKGGDIVVLTGEARLDPDAPPADQHAAYAEKYAEGIKRIGMTPEQFGQAFRTAIRVRPTRLRGH